VLWAVVERATAPAGNTSAARFDAIIVLGAPADDEGNPRPVQLARIAEGVREYERGVAPRLILTGGAVKNQHVEARVMARVAEAQGVPASSLVLETEARDTIQNACYAVRIMREHGWHSAEVVTSADQLPRAELIFSRQPIEWRMHAAPPVEPPSTLTVRARTAVDVLKTVRYLLYTRWMEDCSP
jgi:uncharacterized SAM-binding protein YcdF (DUF218 family)